MLFFFCQGLNDGVTPISIAVEVCRIVNVSLMSCVDLEWYFRMQFQSFEAFEHVDANRKIHNLIWCEHYQVPEIHIQNSLLKLEICERHDTFIMKSHSPHTSPRHSFYFHNIDSHNHYGLINLEHFPECQWCHCVDGKLNHLTSWHFGPIYQKSYRLTVNRTTQRCGFSAVKWKWAKNFEANISSIETWTINMVDFSTWFIICFSHFLELLGTRVSLHWYWYLLCARRGPGTKAIAKLFGCDVVVFVELLWKVALWFISPMFGFDTSICSVNNCSPQTTSQRQRHRSSDNPNRPAPPPCRRTNRDS